jgi:hypothetical protein
MSRIQPKAKSTMGGLSQINLPSQINYPPQQSPNHSGMGGLSKIQMYSQTSNITTNPKNIQSGMRGLSRIQMESLANSNNRNAHGMGGLSRIQMESLASSNNRSVHGMGGLSRIQPFEKSAIQGRSNEYSGMGGLSKIHIGSQFNKTNLNTPIESLNSSKNTTSSSGTTLSKTISNESFKKGTINLWNKGPSNSDVKTLK